MVAPRPPAGPRVVAVERPRTPTLGRSHDDSIAVAKADEAAKREGQLLVEIAQERQRRAETEAREQETAAELARLRAAEEARRRAPAPSPHAKPEVQSVAPAGEALRVRDFRLGDLKGWAALVAGFTGLAVAAVSASKPEKAPQVVDNSATISKLQADLSAQSRRLQKLENSMKRNHDWTVQVLDATGVKICRQQGARGLSAFEANVLQPKAKPKGYWLSVATCQPTLAGRITDDDE